MPCNSRTLPALTAIAAAGLFLMPGCTSPKPGYVARDWSSKMRELGIVPVFPPREDVQVGDIYVTSTLVTNYVGKRFMEIPVFAGRLDVSDALSDYYGSRASFPLTQTNVPEFVKNYTNNPFGLIPQASDCSRNIFLGGDTNRLRLVGFPCFMSVTVFGFDAAASAPIHGIQAALAGGYHKDDSVTISVPVAESYALPAGQMVGMLTDNQGKFKGVRGLTTPVVLQLAGINTNDTDRAAYLHVITEVFYARAVDVSVQHRRTSSAGVSAKPVGTGALASSGSAGANSGPNAGAADRTKAESEKLTAELASVTPGGSVKIVAAGDWGVTMRRVYDRPVAIGYRGFVVGLKPDGSVTHLGQSQFAPLFGPAGKAPEQ